MEEIVKHINDTNASYRDIAAGDAKNTDLFLDQEHRQFFSGLSSIHVILHKDNLMQAMLFISSLLPRKYDCSSQHYQVPFSTGFVFDNILRLEGLFNGNETFEMDWIIRADVPKKTGKIDERFYLNGLIHNYTYTSKEGKLSNAKFTIRDYLAGGYSDIHFRKTTILGTYDVYVTNSSHSYNSSEDNEESYKKPESVFHFYRSYITAIKSKPFLLLAGISGTGKSRIVRELARACWDVGSDEYKAHKPSNFEMVQVKPNWHDSSELIGYVSRVSGEPVFVAGDFLKFVAKAWENPDVPYFLCLDEMNLAPVEQYFAEYLSVVESRKLDGDKVVTDPILKKETEQWYFDLVRKLTENGNVQERFNADGICIPQNLIVVGTVNMDETTFSFSRKVLDRAMTIEMNEVDLNGGLDKRYELIGKLGAAELIGNAVEGVDVYKAYKDVCDKVISYLKEVNDVLEGTPFKIAYRTRNEFLLYVVNNLPYNKDEDGNELDEGFVIARALDEITSMKILSRIEGDESKVKEALLTQLSETIKKGLHEISDEGWAAKETENEYKSVSMAKLEEMIARLKTSGYTSFWS